MLIEEVMDGSPRVWCQQSFSLCASLREKSDTAMSFQSLRSYVLFLNLYKDVKQSLKTVLLMTFSVLTSDSCPLACFAQPILRE